MRVKTTFGHGQHYAIVWGRDVANLKRTKPRRSWNRWRGVVVGQGPTPEAAMEDACKGLRALRHCGRKVVPEPV